MSRLVAACTFAVGTEFWLLWAGVGVGLGLAKW